MNKYYIAEIELASKCEFLLTTLVGGSPEGLKYKKKLFCIKGNGFKETPMGIVKLPFDLPKPPTASQIISQLSNLYKNKLINARHAVVAELDVCYDVYEQGIDKIISISDKHLNKARVIKVESNYNMS